MTMTRNRLLMLTFGWGLVLPGCREAPSGSPASHGAHSAPPPASPRAAEALTGMPPGYAPVDVDQGRQQLLGIRTMAVRRQAIDNGIRTVGIVQSDETRTSHVHVKFDGFIEEIYVNYTGSPVKKGQPLLRIFSRDLLAAQQEYLASREALAPASAPGAE